MIVGHSPVSQLPFSSVERVVMKQLCSPLHRRITVCISFVTKCSNLLDISTYCLAQTAGYLDWDIGGRLIDVELASGGPLMGLR